MPSLFQSAVEIKQRRPMSTRVAGQLRPVRGPNDVDPARRAHTRMIPPIRTYIAPGLPGVPGVTAQVKRLPWRAPERPPPPI